LNKFDLLKRLLEMRDNPITKKGKYGDIYAMGIDKIMIKTMTDAEIISFAEKALITTDLPPPGVLKYALHFFSLYQQARTLKKNYNTLRNYILGAEKEIPISNDYLIELFQGIYTKLKTWHLIQKLYEKYPQAKPREIAQLLSDDTNEQSRLINNIKQYLRWGVKIKRNNITVVDKPSKKTKWISVFSFLSIVAAYNYKKALNSFPVHRNNIYAQLARLNITVPEAKSMHGHDNKYVRKFIQDKHLRTFLFKYCKFPGTEPDVVLKMLYKTHFSIMQTCQSFHIPWRPVYQRFWLVHVKKCDVPLANFDVFFEHVQNNLFNYFEFRGTARQYSHLLPFQSPMTIYAENQKRETNNEKQGK